MKLKNRKNWTIIVLLLSMYFNAFSQLSVRTIAGDVSKPENPKLIYDTLSNIKYHKDLSDYSMYIGQKILFYPRNPESTVKTKYYGNFYLNKEYTLENEVPDTIWYRHRKKVRPSDYELRSPISDRYKPKQVKNKRVCFGNNFLSQSPGDTLKTGYFTPAEEIEGKTFTIIDFKVKKDNYHTGQKQSYLNNKQSLLFTLLTGNNDTIYWQSETLYGSDHFFPAIIVSYYERIKDLFVGQSYNLKDTYNTYFATNLNKGGKYSELKGNLKCVELSLIGNKNQYMTPQLVFQNEAGETLSMRITNSPSLERYIDDAYDGAGYENDKRLKYDSENDKKQFVSDDIKNTYSLYEGSISDLVNTKVIQEKLRIQEEQRIAEEKQAELEKIRIEKESKIRLSNLTKKYGKHIAGLIIKGYVETGMTKKMCIESWGEPDDINKTSSSYGVHEQWVYGNNSYLYFEDGILTTIQN